ncbi:hypothetical protein [Lentzea terrae]|uniref:hypothetical protein n=1 Tax=Lentzea terrae TaxID=2200761 RepID=UPI0013008461|nr:hypothetical protein [Lentzea terrae]
MTLTLSTDELRVAATLEGGRLPVALGREWSEEDIPVADLVALRGLLARGLAIARPGTLEVSLTDEATTISTLLDPSTLVEVHRDSVERAGRWLIAERDGTVVSCAESRPDLWSFGTVDVDLLMADLVAALPDDAVDQRSMRVRTDLLVEADRNVETGEGELAALLANVRSTTTVRRVQRVRGTSSAVAITWLETAGAGAWLVSPVDDHRDGNMPVPHTELSPIGREDLLALVADVLDLSGAER